MVYETFVQEVRDSLQDYLGKDISINIQKITKNNGLTRTALCLLKKGSLISPSIYMESYYSKYMNNPCLPDIVAEIAIAYCTLPEPNLDYLSRLDDYNSIRSKIIFHLIHASSNLDQLSDAPFIPYLDLAIVFYLVVDYKEDSSLQSRVRNDHLKAWGVTVDDLMVAARENTPHFFPAKIRPMSDVLEEMVQNNPWLLFQENVDDGLLSIDELITNMDEEFPMYVLSNQVCKNGSCCLLYDKVLKNFADDLEQDLIILPSSVHEVLITPANPGHASFDYLSEMVTDINVAEVPLEDRLSNQIYLYSRSEDSLEVVSCSPDALNS